MGFSVAELPKNFTKTAKPHAYVVLNRPQKRRGSTCAKPDHVKRRQKPYSRRLSINVTAMCNRVCSGWGVRRCVCARIPVVGVAGVITFAIKGRSWSKGRRTKSGKREAS